MTEKLNNNNLFYIQQFTYANLPIITPLTLCPHAHSLCLHLSSYPADKSRKRKTNTAY